MPSDGLYNGYTSNGSPQPTITRTVTKTVVPYNTSTDLVDPDVVVTKKHEEWTTSKKTVNHKTKQVETRVQRQLVLEDGRVVADSGPQVTTKTKEDVRVEESENSEHKTTGDDPPGAGYAILPGSAQVVSEKTESTKTMTETKEENRQMHDERLRDLDGEELHQRIIVAPDESDFGEGFCNFPGKLTHYSSRSQRVVDQEEVKETSEIKDGEKSTETTRTHHHEEAYDDEVPEEEAEEGMVPERSAETSRQVQYYTDPKEFESVSEQLREESRRSHARLHKSYTNGHSDDKMPAVTNWVDDHFRQSPIDDFRESTRTTSGGNRITIEMTGNRSSPIITSPPDTLRKNKSRDSTLRNRSSYEKSDWYRSPTIRSPSPPYPSSTLSRSHQRMTSSPFEVSSSSGSSRSKTPVKTFYLGEENTYSHNDRMNEHKTRSNRRLAELLKSNLSASESNVYSRSTNLSSPDRHYNDSYRATPSPSYRSPSGTFSRNNGTTKAGPIYSNVRKTNTSKNIQVSMSDEEDDYERYKTTRSYKDRSSSPTAHMERSATTLPRNTKSSNQYSKSLLIPITQSSSKHYKSTESLLSPNYSSYSSTFDYGSTNSFKYSDRRSPVYNNRSGSAASSLRNPRNESYHRNEVSSPYHDDVYYTNRSNRSNGNKEYKSHKTDAYRCNESRNGYEYANGKRSEYAKPSWNGSSGRRGFITTSPPESGYQSPFPPSPPTSPPPRLVKVLNSDHYGSSSSVSPPDSPHHLSSSIRRSAAFPSGHTSRSKSSGDLRSGSKLLPSPTTFSPLSSPTELKTMGEANDVQTFYRVKPGNDGRSVVVQVRDWQAR